MKDSVVFYEKIDTVTGTKEQLYQKSKLWLANTFNSSKAVIEIDDKENGQIVGNGNFDITYTYALLPRVYTVKFTIKIDLKESKYRIQFYNINNDWDENLGVQVNMYRLIANPDKTLSKKILPQVNDRFLKIIKEFDAALRKKEDNNF